jgi:hypothetical protein
MTLKVVTDMVSATTHFEGLDVENLGKVKFIETE